MQFRFLQILIKQAMKMNENKIIVVPLNKNRFWKTNTGHKHKSMNILPKFYS